MRNLLGFFAGLVVLWLLLSGHYTPLLLALGLASCVLTAVISHRMHVIDDESVPLHLLPRLPAYLGWLAIEIAKSAWDVTCRIVNPSRPISPTMVTLNIRQRTAVGQLIFANSITLTPGTVTVDLRDRVAQVHALSEIDADDLEHGDMNQRVCRLEGSGRPRAGGRS